MNMGLTMAASKKRPSAGKKELDYTTFRIYAKDGENLSELADKRNQNIADCYRELFAETVREMLEKLVRLRLQGLERKN